MIWCWFIIINICNNIKLQTVRWFPKIVIVRDESVVLFFGYTKAMKEPWKYNHYDKIPNEHPNLLVIFYIIKITSWLMLWLLMRFWYTNSIIKRLIHGYTYEGLLQTVQFITYYTHTDIYIYIIQYIPIGQSETRICPTWSSNISYISFAKSCIGQLADNCPI